MTSELKDTWTKKQVFRTETEARFSVLQDNRYTTPAAKYWQCVREQATYIDNLMILSFEYRRNQAKISKLEEQIRTEKDLTSPKLSFFKLFLELTSANNNLVEPSRLFKKSFSFTTLEISGGLN